MYCVRGRVGWFEMSSNPQIREIHDETVYKLWVVHYGT